MRVELSDLGRITDVRSLLESEGTFDQKKKLNRSETVISESVIKEIENGVTSEFLDGLKVPIFKYKGQITVHGLFPELSPFTVGNLKRVFQNKNQSVGIKYAAIDYDRKSLVYAGLKLKYGFHIKNNSTAFSAIIFEHVDNEAELSKHMEKVKPVLNAINVQGVKKDCYVGTIPFYGLFFVCEIDFKYLYESDLIDVCKSLFNETPESLLALIKADKDKKEAEAKAAYEKERAEAYQKFLETKNKLVSELSNHGYKVADYSVEPFKLFEGNSFIIFDEFIGCVSLKFRKIYKDNRSLLRLAGNFKTSHDKFVTLAFTVDKYTSINDIINFIENCDRNAVKVVSNKYDLPLEKFYSKDKTILIVS